ncbi:hypothetical protein IP90_02131 [Luteimonas cucumeris]|uniref:Uncharacterized protein n=1 Tax=Luteimonas cucumeris TaxID=985012 RepID=A0A562L5W6_9GAMM|nr:hypothetical protein [Luteimonas cucumeris]TWI03028.1 hypothetical protein IP90_02131 [Luteimonas cucumeris]
MRPQKTEKARSALRDRPAEVSVLERRVLILCDGLRSLDEVADLLGAQARVASERLLQDGYLAGIPAPTSQAPVAIAAIEREQDPAMPASSRRSIAAAKMYVIDMLQLQRGAEATAIAISLRTSRDPEELAAHVLLALRHIHAATSPSYSRRVAARLAEIMPEQYLAELGVFHDALFADEAMPA